MYLKVQYLHLLRQVLNFARTLASFIAVTTGHTFISLGFFSAFFATNVL